MAENGAPTPKPGSEEEARLAEAAKWKLMRVPADRPYVLCYEGDEGNVVMQGPWASHYHIYPLLGLLLEQTLRHRFEATVVKTGRIPIVGG